MKSLKAKLVLVILCIVVLTSLLALTLGLSRSFDVTEDIIQSLVTDKLTSANNMLITYMDQKFGGFSLGSEGQLVDKNRQAIDGEFEYIDRFSQDMGVHATIFARDSNRFVRVLTTVKDSKGERAVGTELDRSGQAYQAVSKGNSYFGEADILGSLYMTGYTPMFDANGQVIGVYFVGVPIESVKNVLNDGVTSTIRSLAMLAVFMLPVVALIVYLISNGISRPIKKVTRVAQQIAEGSFDVELLVRTKDEVGRLANAFNRTIEKLVNYQGYIDEISNVLKSLAHGEALPTGI
ncbi:MAG: Cache 3/Cache 2 fusion domain-containing protein [Oscillospiraceae bacterium]|jgi:methyl-accepting chemotaxis protein